MSEKESSLKQKLGPKKYRQKVEQANKFYDNHMAGKKNPKTGEYYNHISFEDPRKSKVSTACTSTTIGYIECDNCKAEISVGSNSSGKFCLYCGEYIYFSFDMKEKIKNEQNG